MPARRERLNDWVRGYADGRFAARDAIGGGSESRAVFCHSARSEMTIGIVSKHYAEGFKAGWRDLLAGGTGPGVG